MKTALLYSVLCAEAAAWPRCLDSSLRLERTLLWNIASNAVKSWGGVDEGKMLSTAQLRTAIFLEDAPTPRLVIPWHRIKVWISDHC